MSTFDPLSHGSQYTKPGRTKLQLGIDSLLLQELINLRRLCEEGHSVLVTEINVNEVVIYVP